MSLAAVADPQTTIDERIVEDTALENALVTRQNRKVAASAARKSYTEADEAAKEKIAALELEDGDVVRCGRFAISKRRVEAREVSFETGASSRLSIRALDE